MAKVSVIIPIYNMASYLSECLESVTSQTLADVEIICVNDGSTDKSAKIIKQFARRDKRIIYIKQMNMGVAHARNNGILAAGGEFVSFIDPDDFYPDECVLEDLYNAAKKNSVKICGGSFSNFIDGANEINTVFKVKDWGYSFGEDRLWNYSDYQFDYGYHRFIFERSMLIESGIVFPAYLRFQDPPFFVKAMITAGQFYALSRVSYRYRWAHKEVNWNGPKVISVLAGVIDNLKISREYGLADLHALTLRRLETVYTAIEAELNDEYASEIVDLLFNMNKCIDEDMIRDSRFSEADIKTAQNRIIAALCK